MTKEETKIYFREYANSNREKITRNWKKYERFRRYKSLAYFERARDKYYQKICDKWLERTLLAGIRHQHNERVAESLFHHCCAVRLPHGDVSHSVCSNGIYE